MGDINFEYIPKELKAFPNWVCWTIEERDGKLTKIPINPKTGGKAQPNNPSTWTSYDEAVAKWRNCENGGIEGIGFVLTNDYAGVDLDHCRDLQTGKVETWAQKIVTQLNSYTEVTPSGTGLRVWIKGKLPSGRRKRANIEMYDGGRFFTVTGQHVQGTPWIIHDGQDEIKKIHNEIFGNGHKKRTSEKTTPLTSLSLSDIDLIEKAKTALNGEKFSRLWNGDFSEYPSQSEADLALCLLLAF